MKNPKRWCHIVEKIIGAVLHNDVSVIFFRSDYFSLWRPSWSGPPFLMMTLSTVNDDYPLFWTLMDNNNQEVLHKTEAKEVRLTNFQWLPNQSGNGQQMTHFSNKSISFKLWEWWTKIFSPFIFWSFCNKNSVNSLEPKLRNLFIL